MDIKNKTFVFIGCASVLGEATLRWFLKAFAIVFIFVLYYVLQSLYVAYNVCSAVDYFRNLGGSVGVAGIVINRDDGTGEAKKFAEKVGIPVLSTIPADDDIRRKSAMYQIIGTKQSQWGNLFETLATNVAGAPPVRPTTLNQDELLGLFDGGQTGAGFTLVPATDADMRGKFSKPKKSLEVIYDKV